jgi:hypothetical protein
MGGLMSLPMITEQPVTSIGDTDTGEGWIVTVFDNDVNTFDEVVTVLIRATACTIEEAQIETWEIDNLGKSVVHQGGKDECCRSAGIIAEIGIRVEVSQE